MLRIVHMHFRPGEEKAFLEIFEEMRSVIQRFDGCRRLDLFQSCSDPLHYTTVSEWKDHASLEQYRNSEVFKALWPKVKRLFSKPAEAYSLEAMHNPGE